MDRYPSAEGFRNALDERLKNRARETDTSLDRLRRRVVFERLLARLESTMPGLWVVKGGMALEIRLSDRARRTRDIDLALRDGAFDLHARLVDALAADPFGDRFEYVVSAPRSLATDDAGRQGWRFAVEARLAGRTFERVTMDVVERRVEIAPTTIETFPSLTDFAGFPPVIVEVIEPRQHFAEKLHAYTRDYGGMPSSRSRDLPDMVLLIEDGLVPDNELYAVAERLFQDRDTHELPEALPDPPASWEESYRDLVRDLDVGPTTLSDATTMVRAFWSTAVEARKETGHAKQQDS
jgi:hypothetical protein